jgi:hypothetical protein
MSSWFLMRPSELAFHHKFIGIGIQYVKYFDENYRQKHVFFDIERKTVEDYGCLTTIIEIREQMIYNIVHIYTCLFVCEMGQLEIVQWHNK